VNAQDKNGGGWRYFPGQVGDTTVTGWMLMALKSGQLTYVPVSPEVWTGAKRYLDFVQDDGGAAYGYQAPSKQDATMTAIGLLCRMYAGWPRSQAALARGVRMLSKRGPSEHDLYYDYYATQVLRHYGGPEWTDWNSEDARVPHRHASQGRARRRAVGISPTSTATKGAASTTRRWPSSFSRSTTGTCRSTANAYLGEGY
jgi:hypothetical protein